MKGESLGELEELILLSIGSLGDDAYAVAIQQELSDKARRTPDITAIHSVLRRLEAKGFATSDMGGATNERGGRRKRYYTMTVAGRKALDNSMVIRMELYKKLLTAEG